MSRRRRNGYMIAAVIGLAIAGAVWWSTGPHYQGRSLSSWVRQYMEADDGSQGKLEAQRAIRAMPGKRVASQLVRFAKQGVDARDGLRNAEVRDCLMAVAERLNVPSAYLTWLQRQDDFYAALAGFEAMGTNAAVAIPGLVALGKEHKYEVIAVECLGEIGPPARQVVCEALTNTNSDVRGVAVSSLPNVFVDVRPMLQALKPLLHDRDFNVRRSAINVVGFQQDAPDLAIPLLCKVVRDGDSNDVIAALPHFVRFGTNALQAVSTLSNLVEWGSSSAAARVGLGALAKIDSAQALPLVLRKCKSPDVLDRQLAVQLLVTYTNKTAGIFSTLEEAARDPSPAVAREAQIFFTEHYKHMYPNGPPFEAEPMYGGKQLGYWLKQRNREGEMPTEARAAIKAMGSNAVPALLSRFFYTYRHGVPAYEVNMEAVGGFAVLGEAGVAALPKLQPVMDGTDEMMAVYALMAVSQMGERGNECIIRGLTNNHEIVREQAVSLVMEQHQRFSIQQRVACVGVLTNMLIEKDDGMRISVTNALVEMAPDVAAKLGVKRFEPFMPERGPLEVHRRYSR